MELCQINVISKKTALAKRYKKCNHRSVNRFLSEINITFVDREIQSNKTLGYQKSSISMSKINDLLGKLSIVQQLLKVANIDIF